MATTDDALAALSGPAIRVTFRDFDTGRVGPTLVMPFAHLTYADLRAGNDRGGADTVAYFDPAGRRWALSADGSEWTDIVLDTLED